MQFRVDGLPHLQLELGLPQLQVGLHPYGLLVHTLQRVQHGLLTVLVEQRLHGLCEQRLRPRQ
jgi:hypothetical protein